jgi:hypothetical protein
MHDDALDRPGVGRGYCIDRLIGSGGAATVYEARRLGRGGPGARVACKVMHAQRRTSARQQALVWQEAVLGLRLTAGHPNLVEVIDFFDDAEERLCIVMELVDGASVAEMCPAGSRVPAPLVRRIAVDVLEALAHVHGRGVLHRDVSPRNLLVTTGGAVKLADMGVARVMERGQVHTQTLCATPVYASYEAIQLLPLDERADLYSLAAVLYELISGLPPYGVQPTMTAVVAQILMGKLAPLPPDTPPDLAELVMGLLQRDREARRPQSAAAGLALLRAHEQPIASPEELAALIDRGRARREHEIAAALAAAPPGRVLAPGHVLSPWEERALPVRVSRSTAGALPEGPAEQTDDAVPGHVEDLLPTGLADAFVDALDGDGHDALDGDEDEAWHPYSPEALLEAMAQAMASDAPEADGGRAQLALPAHTDDAPDEHVAHAPRERVDDAQLVVGEDPRAHGSTRWHARASRRFSTRRVVSVAATLACGLVLGILFWTDVLDTRDPGETPRHAVKPAPGAEPAPPVAAPPTPAPAAAAPRVPGSAGSLQQTEVTTEPRGSAEPVHDAPREPLEAQRSIGRTRRAPARPRAVSHGSGPPTWGQR